jgi:F-type H+-transporting ATPase subunit a
MATPATDPSVAASAATDTAAIQGQVMDYVWHHILNSQEWHLPFVPTIHLPAWMGLHQVMLLIAAAILIVLFCFVYRTRDGVPSGISNLLEVFVVFVRDQITLPAFGEHDGRKMTPLMCSFFFFVLCLNLMGLIPLFVTATANLMVTGAMAATVLAFMILGGLIKNGPMGLLHAFMPGGVPKALLLLLVPLEMVGVLIKTFALMIRLFANMLAGHVVVFSLIGMMAVFGLWGLPAIAMAVFIMLIELLVAVLQAYIFTLLAAMFIGQIYHPAH